MNWQVARFLLSLRRPLVMGIVNVTPDSFSDGARHAAPLAAGAHCDRLLAEGADILDIGGESTRPGAQRPDLEQEWARLLPVLQHAVTLGVPISVDTSRPEVMQRALDLGVDIVNDVRALTEEGAVDVLVRTQQAGICLMHMRGSPDSMEHFVDYRDVAGEVRQFLQDRLKAVTDAGVAANRIVLDPGIGFAKTAEQNWTLLRRQGEIASLGRPVLVGWSRKSPLGQLTGRSVEHRVGASVAAALASIQRGAAIVRVHDVAETVDAIKVWQSAGLTT